MPESANHQNLIKRLLTGAFLLLLLTTAVYRQWAPGDSGQTLTELYEQQAEQTWLEFSAEVVRLLSDDNDGSRHQRFIVRSGETTVLIAHNIDLAPRVPVAAGDQLNIRGRYEWNRQGGVVHWTHHDPQNRLPGGWIEHRQKKFK
jgi:hypothetical protein